MDDVFLAMKRDYFSIVGGVVGQVTMPKEERMVRRAIDEAITASDAVFREVIDGELDDLKAKFAVSIDETENEPKEDSLMTDNDEDSEDEDKNEADGTANMAAEPGDAMAADNDVSAAKE